METRPYPTLAEATRVWARIGLLSFGGPYSNHLHAIAALGQALNIPVIAVVRGYAHLPLTATLQDCQSCAHILISNIVQHQPNFSGCDSDSFSGGSRLHHLFPRLSVLAMCPR